MTSPGSSVMIVEMYETSVAGSNTRSPVSAFCISSPSTSQVISRLGPGASSAVTSHGPIGVVASNVLPCSHCSVRFW